jgi:hypothetical protein
MSSYGTSTRSRGRQAGNSRLAQARPRDAQGRFLPTGGRGSLGGQSGGSRRMAGSYAAGRSGSRSPNYYAGGSRRMAGSYYATEAGRWKNRYGAGFKPDAEDRRTKAYWASRGGRQAQLSEARARRNLAGFAALPFPQGGTEMARWRNRYGSGFKPDAEDRRTKAYWESRGGRQGQLAEARARRARGGFAALPFPQGGEGSFFRSGGSRSRSGSRSGSPTQAAYMAYMARGSRSGGNSPQSRLAEVRPRDAQGRFLPTGGRGSLGGSRQFARSSRRY